MTFFLANNLVGSAIGILFLGVGVTIVVASALATAANEVKQGAKPELGEEGSGSDAPRAIDRLAKR